MRRIAYAAQVTLCVLGLLAWTGLPFWAQLVVERAGWSLSSWFYNHPWWAGVAMVGAVAWMIFWCVLLAEWAEHKL